MSDLELIEQCVEMAIVDLRGRPSAANLTRALGTLRSALILSPDERKLVTFALRTYITQLDDFLGAAKDGDVVESVRVDRRLLIDILRRLA